MRKVSESRQVGFTLVELLVVIAVIGILISLILVAAADGVRRAEERATQSLITKLEAALNDRLDALLNAQAPITQTHRNLAAISGTTNSYDRRAQVIAQFDYIRAELPDVFFLNSAASDGPSPTNLISYPLNFAAVPYPLGNNNLYNFVLPLGIGYDSTGVNPGGIVEPVTAGSAAPSIANQTPVTGMFGASFSAAGGLYKNLGYAPQGYDGVDNNGNGYIDELAESGLSAPPASLANHTHKTARSEMLYAILVEGLGPLGSAFSRDDFTAKEVQDTDGDGLPEFVDAWGEPLQFYRWPIYYGGPQPNGNIFGTSDSQRGSLQYNGFSQPREQDPLDPNQMLMAPSWWAGASASVPSGGAISFMNTFHSLIDPYPGDTTTGTSWDRGGSYYRRAFFSKFLILSGGPDRIPGVPQFALDYSAIADASLSSPYTFQFPNGTMQQNALNLITIENQAAVSDPTLRTGTYSQVPDTASALTTFLQQNANSDDITNHNISGPSTGVR